MIQENKWNFTLGPEQFRQVKLEYQLRLALFEAFVVVLSDDGRSTALRVSSLP